MTFAVVPPPVTVRVLVAEDSRDLARAMTGGYACARCKAGLKEHGSELCLGCEVRAEASDFEQWLKGAVRS